MANSLLRRSTIYFRAFKWHLLAIVVLIFVHGAVHADESNNISQSIALPAAVQTALDKADADIAKVNAALVEKLKKAETDAAKRNNLDLALWLNKKIERLQPKKEQATTPPDFAGPFNFRFTNGHQGVLEIRKHEATEEGHTGVVSTNGTGWIIAWDNGTRWLVSAENADWAVTTSDGKCLLAVSDK